MKTHTEHAAHTGRAKQGERRPEAARYFPARAFRPSGFGTSIDFVPTENRIANRMASDLRAAAKPAGAAWWPSRNQTTRPVNADGATVLAPGPVCKPAEHWWPRLTQAILRAAGFATNI